MYIRRRWSRTSVQWQIYIKCLPLGKVTGKCSSGHCPWNDIYICRFAHIVQDFVLGVKNIYIYRYIHINFFGRLLLRMCIDILQMWLLVSSIHFLVNHVVILLAINQSNNQTNYLSIYLSTCLSISLSMHLSIYQCIYLSIYLSI